MWTDDGDHLIYTARLERSPGYDWWVVSVLEGDPVAMGAQTALGSQGLSRANAAGYQIPPGPDSWDQDGSIIFSAASGSTENLWRFRRPAADWRITGPAEQVTFGVAIERQAAIAADGTIVFSGLVERQNIWCAYGNPDAWVETDEIAALTSSPAADAQATVSADGTRIVFLSDRSGQNDVWYKDLSTGADAALTANPEMEAFPVISRDGSKAAFVVRTPGQANPVFVTDLDRGSPRKLCDDCAGAVRSWRFDASKLFFQAGPRSIFAMDPETGEHSEYLRSDDGLPAACRVSWDDRWLAFSQHGRSLYIVPLDESRPPARDQWIEVVEGTYRDDKPRWSPNGAFLYFTSSRDGFVCIWAQRLDPPTKQPIGEPYPIQHFHQAGRSMPRGSELAVARDKLVFDLTENTGNIWMLEPGGAE